MFAINITTRSMETGLASALFLSLLLFACVPILGQSAPPDLIIIRANIHTMDKANPTAEAVAVKAGRISAIGTTEDIQNLAGKETKVIDAKGRLLLPGFNDSHAHFMAIGNIFSSIDLSDAKTEDEVIAKFKHFARFLPKGRWILGGKLDPSISLTSEKVDAVTPENPVFVYHSDPKTAYANAVTLKIARLDPISRVLDARAVSAVKFVVPKDHVRDWPAIAETATNYATSFGVTSVTDTHSDDMAVVFRELDRAGKLKNRIYDCISLFNWAKLAAVGTRAAEGSPMVRIGCVKGFYDPDDPETANLAKNIAGADSAGLQVLVHSIGKDANAAVLAAMEKAIAVNGARDRRFRIEHAAGVSAEDLPRFARSNIVPSMQPILFSGGSDDYRKMLDSGARLAFGADAPMKGFDPIEGIAIAVGAGKRALTVDEAVYAYTMGSAYAEFQEKEKGSVEVGKLADLVLLSSDIFAEKADIRAAKVVLTVAGGRIVYENTN